MRAAHALVLAAATFTLGLSACQDAVTTPDTSQPGAHAPLLSGDIVGTFATPYMCTVTRTGPTGTRLTQESLNFPVALHAAGGRSMGYRYRRQSPAGKVTYAADCVIPRTMGALEHVNQRFRVPPELGAPKGQDRTGNEFTTQGCVSDGLCILEPIVVVAPVEEDEKLDDDTGIGSGGGGDPGVGGSGGGGTSSAAPALSDDGIQDPVLPDCSQPQTVEWRKAYCAGAPANGTTLFETNQALNRIRAKGGECANIAAHGDTFLNNNQVRYFHGSGADLKGWGHPQVAVIIDDRVIGRSPPYNHDLFLVHEIEHAMGRGHIGKDANGVDMTPNDGACS